MSDAILLYSGDYFVRSEKTEEVRDALTALHGHEPYFVIDTHKNAAEMFLYPIVFDLLRIRASLHTHRQLESAGSLSIASALSLAPYPGHRE